MIHPRLEPLGKRRKEFGETEGLIGPSERARASQFRELTRIFGDDIPPGNPLDEGERTRLACRFQRPRWKHRGKVFDGASNTTAGAAVLSINCWAPLDQ